MILDASEAVLGYFGFERIFMETKKIQEQENGGRVYKN